MPTSPDSIAVFFHTPVAPSDELFAMAGSFSYLWSGCILAIYNCGEFVSWSVENDIIFNDGNTYFCVCVCWLFQTRYACTIPYIPQNTMIAHARVSIAMTMS